MEMYALDISALRGREAETLALLSPQRREKALRLRGDARLRSAAAGLLLRRYVGEGPFLPGTVGKPCLPGGIEFNLSHSASLAVLAVGDRAVGADVERIAPFRAAVLSRVLTEEERRWMAAEPERRFAFLWTRKEAVLKCAGCGLSRPMRSFCVLPGASPRLDGAAYALHTAEYNGYMISAAAEGDAAFSLTVLTGEEFFPKEW